MDEVRSSNQVPMDEMNSLNPMNVFESMSSDQMEYSEGFEVHKSVSENGNLTWIDEMDKYLVDRLMEQMHKGQKIGGVFTKTAYAIVAREIGENFELSNNSEHIKNRMKT
ncbi:hypothetical protein PVL29_004728 [Vitis rotundifolia]|uniref:Myb/SANT-like domain-containing protein n=1 Tax=Vitis rotundifolia TaxID=103349 RepID=A0AA39A9S7_VITRO|nr:hypothetical protein PVL29_004728 [Vitis rotundifolia]